MVGWGGYRVAQSASQLNTVLCCTCTLRSGLGTPEAPSPPPTSSHHRLLGVILLLLSPPAPWPPRRRSSSRTPSPRSEWEHPRRRRRRRRCCPSSGSTSSRRSPAPGRWTSALTDTGRRYQGPTNVASANFVNPNVVDLLPLPPHG